MPWIYPRSRDDESMNRMRPWRIRRQPIGRSDAQTRWDQAHQHLLQWTVDREGACTPAAPLAPEQEVLMRIVPSTPVSRPADKPKHKPLAQPLERLQAHVHAQGETVDERAVFRDASSSGASLGRPGLDQLRDRAALAEFDQVVVTAPDRLARVS
jgi:Resolvase, N terminal domain